MRKLSAAIAGYQAAIKCTDNAAVKNRFHVFITCCVEANVKTVHRVTFNGLKEEKIKQCKKAQRRKQFDPILCASAFFLSRRCPMSRRL
ncbi:MAG: hypothetical protein ACR2RB_17380 [Gammaproteobacteria bacterium]